MCGPKQFLSSLLLICLLDVAFCFTKSFHPDTYKLEETREIRIKQGRLKGFIHEPSTNRELQKVEVYLGVPYAAPPVGTQRFMPPGSPPPWTGVKMAKEHGPVCPQKLPDLSLMTVSEQRRKYLRRLMPYLQEESEDCLYLNIYAPIKGNMRVFPKYPVMVFIHGESFDWNSGNAYDGSALASYGHVVVVTFNFRLGILGFLRPVVSQDSIGNFGLLDQIAALQWVQENITPFGGDPNSVTIMGHGTGAACANYLLVSPVTESVQGLFHRAILMSGTALSDWALTPNGIEYTIQVAHALNCPATADLLVCLRRKRLAEIKNVTVQASPFVTTFGPVVDGKAVPNKPEKLMGVYNELFSRYELLYGMTQLESLPLLRPVDLQMGQLKEEHYQLLMEYLRERFERYPDIAFASTVKAYTPDWSRHMDPVQLRNAVLDILTDARVAAPMVQTADYHCDANPKSYLYVFTHKSQFGYYRETSLDRSVHGEELPYVFGLPIDGGSQQPHAFSPDEELLAEAVVTYWTNFAKTGNPNAPHRNSFLSQSYREWRKFDVSWPEYDLINQTYMDLAIPPKPGRRYREQEMIFWNKILPDTLNDSNIVTDPARKPTSGDVYHPSPPPIETYLPPPLPPSKPIPPPVATNNTQSDGRGSPTHTGKKSDTMIDSSSVALTIVIIIGVCFLLVNMCAFAGLYYQRDKLKVQEELMKRKYEDLGLANEDVYMKKSRDDLVCEDVVISKKNLKKKNKMIDSGVGGGEDDYEAIRSAGKTLEAGGSGLPGVNDYGRDGGVSGGSGMKKWTLSRQCSASTMDPNTKVREWIAHEIVQRCSPRFMRRKHQQQHLPIQASTSIDTSIDQLSCSVISPVALHDPPPSYTLTDTSKPIPMTTLQRSKVKKISVAVDATPAARSASIQKQLSSEQHISKSMDELGNCVSTSMITLVKKPALKRSATTVEDLPSTLTPIVPRSVSPKDRVRRSTTNISLQVYPPMIQRQNSGDIIKIDHKHSKSDPVQDTTPFMPIAGDKVRVGQSQCIHPQIINIPADPKHSDNYKKHGNTKNQMQTFPTGSHIKSSLKKDASVTASEIKRDINVTSRDSGDEYVHDQQSGDPLKNIQRRNFPKVLPDLPQDSDLYDVDDRELSPVQANSVKRRSLPSSSHLTIGILPPVHETGTVSQPTTPTVNVPFKDGQSGITLTRVPPPPPPRVSSTLGRKPSNNAPLSPIVPPTLPIKQNTSSSTTNQPPNYQRPEPKVIIKPTTTNPVTRNPQNKTTSNKQPIPRVTPNNPEPYNAPPLSQQKQQRPNTTKVQSQQQQPERRHHQVQTAPSTPVTLPSVSPTHKPTNITKTLIKMPEVRLTCSKKSSTGTSTSNSSDADDNSSNTGTVKRVKKPVEKLPQAHSAQTANTKSPQSTKPTIPQTPKNWYAQYNQSFMSKTKDEKD